MSHARYIIGDTRDVTAGMADNSVDLVLTSPPFLALRSYLPADHPDKWREIGSEPDPATFIDMLLELTAEWGRVLTRTGSICVELGDTYSGDDRRNSETVDPKTPHRSDIGRAGSSRANCGKGWPLTKSKALIPELYRIALAYGINPLTGNPSPAGRWRVRNVVTWCRPNPPVGALGDKFRPATSDMVIACRASDRWFDLDAVRGPLTDRKPDTSDPRLEPNKQRNGTNFNTLGPHDPSQSAGAPPLDYWVIPPTGYAGSHYAVYPPELCRIPIDSMCPRQVCRTCGEPRRRIVENPNATGIAFRKTADDRGTVSTLTPKATTSVTLGWTDCGHDNYRPGIVLDPFAGSGTTLMVATGMGRNAIGIDIDERNADLARERCGMFLAVEDHRAGGAA